MIPNLDKPSINWDINKKVFTKQNVLPLDICDAIIEYGNDCVKPGINKYPHAFQTSFYACLLPLNHPVHTLLAPLWEEIVSYFQFSIDFIEPYELKRYNNGDFFGSHQDNYYGLDKPIDRKITMVIQLSDENSYQGGYLKILKKFASKTKGSVTAFPSYFPHEVIKTIGCRWSLIGWAWGPYWK